MTRKDYIAIAAAIRAAQTRINQSTGAWMTSDVREAQLRGVRRVAAHLADELKADNPKGFDAALFLINCGYGATTMNPRDPALDLRPLEEPVADTLEEHERSRKAWEQREETERLPRKVEPIVDKQVWPD